MGRPERGGHTGPKGSGVRWRTRPKRARRTRRGHATAPPAGANTSTCPASRVDVVRLLAVLEVGHLVAGRRVAVEVEQEPIDPCLAGESVLGVVVVDRRVRAV